MNNFNTDTPITASEELAKVKRAEDRAAIKAAVTTEANAKLAKLSAGVWAHIQNEINNSGGRNMTAKEFFYKSLDTFVHFPNDNSASALHRASELHRACGKVSDINDGMSINARPNFKAVVQNPDYFAQWEANGRTFAEAVGRIRPVIEEKYGLVST